MLDQKVGHTAKLKENLVNTLEAEIFASSNFVRMFVLMSVFKILLKFDLVT